MVQQTCQFELNSLPEGRSAERVYTPVDLSVKTVQAAGKNSFVNPVDLTKL